MADGEAAPIEPANQKFQNPVFTATGERRAHVTMDHLETLWINTGTLCNIECAHCYIESSPTNDRLVYMTATELAPFLDEAAKMGAREIGFTGGEPFMNSQMPDMARASLEAGFDVLILTNAMRPMMRPKIKAALLALNKEYGEKLRLRISLDHFDMALHDEERGAGSFTVALEGASWLSAHDFSISAAARLRWGDQESTMREGFAQLFARERIAIDAADPGDLILFPEMDETADVPEITEACWNILDVSPNAMMCASSRMIVKRKGAKAPTVVACTLLAYDPQFELGSTLSMARRKVALNHPHCAKFCVLGGASCSG